MLVKTILCAFLCLLLTSCGFHMRGTDASQINLAAVTITATSHDILLENSLREVAAKNNVLVKPNAQWTIKINQSHVEKLRISASVTAEQDRFTLNYRVTFYLIQQHSDHEDSFGPIRVERQTVFQSDENQVISKYNEEQAIIKELSIKVAEVILQRSAFIANSPPTCKAHHEDQIPATP